MPRSRGSNRSGFTRRRVAGAGESSASCSRLAGLAPLHDQRHREDRHDQQQCEVDVVAERGEPLRSEEHTSELQSLMRISYAVFCLKKKKKPTTSNNHKRHKKTQLECNTHDK